MIRALKLTAIPALRVSALLFLVIFLATPESFAPVFAPLTHDDAPPIYTHGDMAGLALSHVRTVLIATTGSAALAISLAILVTRQFGAEFLPLARALVNIGQTFPPVAVLAIAVPLVGFGETPTLIALFLYGLLPIFENTVSGLQQVPDSVSEAARGAGMDAWQELIGIDLPLALPLILEGLRLSLIINIGTATIGSTVAAKGLGEVIIAGLQSDNTAFILQGGLVVALIAMLLHDAMAWLETLVARPH